MHNAPKILLAALDWGLGHAGRLVPVAKQLQQMGAKVSIACTARQQLFFEQELTHINYLPLCSYGINYPIGNRNFTWHMLKQLPKIMAAIRMEHRTLNGILQNHTFDAVISDNRYGFYSSEVTSIMLCHQLLVKFPVLSRLCNKAHARLLAKFAQVWVPDNEPPQNLSGQLSEHKYVQGNCIGILSRLHKVDLPIVPHHVLLVLTGPQEAKQVLYHSVMQQLQHTTLRIIVVGAAHLEGSYHNATLLGVVAMDKLQELYCSSQTIISHSGYSTLMDLCAVQRHAILVATAGQTEQEYLAQYVSQHNWHLGYAAVPSQLAKIIESLPAHSFAALPALHPHMLNNKLQLFLQNLN